MIEVRHLTKRYGEKLAVDDLSFTIKPNQVYGFLGPNGAGKSTTMNIITGCLAATDGDVVIDGHDIFEEPDKAKKCIGYLPEFPPLYVDMTPDEYLKFVGSAKGLKGEKLKKDIDYVEGVAGVADVRHRLIRNLSKGYKQRVGVAQALLGNPDIIILDEPTVGLDPRQIIEIRDLIKNLGQEHTVVLSSHILSEISAVCDEILIINKGRLVANDTAENLKARYGSGNVVVIEVKGVVDDIIATLEKSANVKSVKVTNADISGVITAEVACGGDEDIREEIFYAMQGIGCPIISMNVKQSSLEDVFLNLTSDGQTAGTRNDDGEKQSENTAAQEGEQ